MPVNDPSDSKEQVEATLGKWGWTCGEDFWSRYHQDPWVFNLVNALTRTDAEVERLRAALAARPQPLCGTCGQPLENGKCFRYHPETPAGSATPTGDDDG